jgi:hypothetical protein
MSERNPITGWGVAWVEHAIEVLVGSRHVATRREAIAHLREALDEGEYVEIDGKQRSIATAYLDGLIRGSRP